MTNAEHCIPVTLATLIREGSRLRPQGFGAFFPGKNSCVFGAAHEAQGGKRGIVGFPVMQNHGLEDLCAIGEVPCPVEGCEHDDGAWPQHLNDDHKWSREAIAAFLDTLWIQPYALVPRDRPWLSRGGAEEGRL